VQLPPKDSELLPPLKPRTPSTSSTAPDITGLAIGQLDGDISTTISMLFQLGVTQELADLAPASGRSGLEVLLARPTFRFVHRVVLAVSQKTGFPRGITVVWPSMEEGKLEVIGQVWSAVVDALSLEDVEFCAADVLRCTRRERTRRFLQLLLVAAKQHNGRDSPSDRTSPLERRPLTRVRSGAPLF